MSHGKRNSHFFSFYCDYSNSLTLSNRTAGLSKKILSSRRIREGSRHVSSLAAPVGKDITVIIIIMSLGICVSQVGEYISLGICVSQVGGCISVGICIPM